MNFSAWQLLLKSLPQKSWPQYFGSYTDNTDGTYTYLGNDTDGTNWNCIHKYNEINGARCINAALGTISTPIKS